MPADAGLLAVHMVLAAFAGGAIGAAIGPLPSLSVAGVAIVVGEATSLPGDVAAGASGANSSAAVNTSTSAAGGTPGTVVNGTDGLASVGGNALTAVVGLGPALGPHVAFAGGVAATAYAARKGYLDAEFEYHAAKHVAAPLGSKPDVLLVGGVFGVVGYWLTQLSIQVGLPWEPVAASVVLSGLLHRVVFGYPLLGSINGGLLDMTPFEEGKRRMAADGSDGDETLSGRYVVEPWLPAHYQWGNVVALGLVVGLFGGVVALETGSYYLAFGLALAALLVASAGVDRFPVVHHMALPASVAALAVSASAPLGMAVAAAFGAFGALAGEFAQRVFYAHADTHLDPSFVSILVTSLVIAVLDVAGLFTQSAVPTAGLA